MFKRLKGWIPSKLKSNENQSSTIKPMESMKTMSKCLNDYCKQQVTLLLKNLDMSVKIENYKVKTTFVKFPFICWFGIQLSFFSII